MTRRLFAVAAACAAGFALATPAHAQDAAEPLEVVSVDTGSLPEVTVTVTAPPELVGRDLPPASFRVSEAGEERRARVTRLPNDELEVVLVIDTSGSMAGAAIEAAKSAAVSFVSQMPSETRVAVLGFGNAPYLISPFSTDPSALTVAIESVQENGETALYDGLVAAADLFQAADARRSIVVLSDGGDTASVTSRDAAAARLAATGGRFYAVALLTAETDLASLDALAAATAGRVVPAGDPAALTSLYDAIADELVNQYEISWRSRVDAPSRVQITVEHQSIRAEALVTADLTLPERAVPERPDNAVEVVRTGLASRPWALALAAAAFFGALVAAGLLLTAPRERRSTLAGEARQARGATPRAGLTELADRATSLADRTLHRRGRHGALNEALERAGIDVRPGEFAVLVVAGAFTALAVGVVVAGIIAGLVLAALVVLGFRLTVSFLAARRRTRFADQLADTLQLLAGSLRAGHGLVQAIDTVAREADSPTADEFRRVVIETRLGQDLGVALRAQAQRIGNDDFEWVVQAIDIHREVGGDLAELFDQVATTIRDRARIRRQVQALSAEGRLSAVILFVMPFVMLLVIGVLNREYLGELTGSTIGHVMLAFGGGLMLLGGVWLRRIVRLVF